ESLGRSSSGPMDQDSVLLGIHLLVQRSPFVVRRHHTFPALPGGGTSIGSCLDGRTGRESVTIAATHRAWDYLRRVFGVLWGRSRPLRSARPSRPRSSV